MNNISTYVFTYLNSFDDVESICQTLRKFKIKGKLGNAEDCPISRLLMNRFPGYRFHVSGSVGIGWPGWKAFIDSDIEWYWVTAIPPAITNFIIEFDAGRFPEFYET